MNMLGRMARWRTEGAMSFWEAWRQTQLDGRAGWLLVAIPVALLLLFMALQFLFDVPIPVGAQ
jgi:hypothetical protein